MRVKFRNFHTWINNARFKFDPDATTIPQIRMKSLHGSKLNKSSCLDLGPCIHHVTCNFPPKLPIMKIISIKNYLLCFILVINSFKMSKIPISNLSLSIFWKKDNFLLTNSALRYETREDQTSFIDYKLWYSTYEISMKTKWTFFWRKTLQNITMKITLPKWHFTI